MLTIHRLSRGRIPSLLCRGILRMNRSKQYTFQWELSHVT
jgi:hypothetical protein